MQLAAAENIYATGQVYGAAGGNGLPIGGIRGRAFLATIQDRPMWYLYGFVLLAGVANAVQAGQNGALSKGLAESLTAGLIVAMGTGGCIPVVGLISGRLTWPTYEQVVQMPWWAWFGGILGASIILAQFVVARQIGAAPFLGLLVTAGVLASIVLDHFGWVGFDRHPLNVLRALGDCLMVVGVALVAVF